MKKYTYLLIALALLLPTAVEAQSVNGPKKKNTTTKTTPAKRKTVLSVNGYSENFALPEIPSDGKTITVDVTTNATAVKVTHVPSWCTLQEYSTSQITIKVDANTSTDSRRGSFLISTSDEQAVIIVTIAQKGGQSVVEKPSSNYTGSIVSLSPTVYGITLMSSTSRTAYANGFIRESDTYAVRKEQGDTPHMSVYWRRSDNTQTINSLLIQSTTKLHPEWGGYTMTYNSWKQFLVNNGFTITKEAPRDPPLDRWYYVIEAKKQNILLKIVLDRPKVDKTGGRDAVLEFNYSIDIID